MKKGSKVVHWTSSNDDTIRRMRKAGATWEAVAKAVSTRAVKRSPEATMQRSRYLAGKQTKKPAKKAKNIVHGRSHSPSPSLQNVPRTTTSSTAPGVALLPKSVTVGGKTLSLPSVE